jgi:anti-sigma B factor antagonist
MPESKVSMNVVSAGDGVRVIEVEGEITTYAEGVFTDAFAQASADGTKAVLIDFGGLEYMNSGGIGLLVTMLIRAQRANQRLLACGLSDHYRQIFSLTRLEEAIEVHDDRAGALSAAGV